MPQAKIERYETREEWLAARAKSIGGSDAPAIHGIGHRSKLALWAEKTGLAPRNFEPTERMTWGRRLEASILAGYAEETGAQVTHVDDVIYRRTDKAYLTFSPDGLLPDQRLVEVKNIDKAYWKDEVPLHHRVQVQHGLAVTGTDKAVYVALIGGNTLAYEEVGREDGFLSAHEAACDAFWSAVERLERPAPDDSESSKRVLRALHPLDSGDVVVLGPPYDKWDEQYRDACERIKEADRLKTQAEAMIMSAMGNASEAKLPGGAVWTWKTRQVKAYTSNVAARTDRVLRRKS